MEGAQFLCNDCGKSFIDEVKLSMHHYNVHSEKLLNALSVVKRGMVWSNLKTT